MQWVSGLEKEGNRIQSIGSFKKLAPIQVKFFNSQSNLLNALEGINETGTKVFLYKKQKQ